MWQEGPQVHHQVSWPGGVEKGGRGGRGGEVGGDREGTDGSSTTWLKLCPSQSTKHHIHAVSKHTKLGLGLGMMNHMKMEDRRKSAL